MKLLVIFFTVLLLASCANNKTTTQTAPLDTSTLPPTLAELVQESKKINTSSNISKLVDNVKLNSNNPDPLYGLGYIHMQTSFTNKNNQEQALAVRYFNEVLRIAPGNQAVLEALYNIYYDQTLTNKTATAYDDAITTFKQISASTRAKMNPPSLAKFVATAYSQEKEKKSNRQALRELLLKAIQESPQSENAYIHLAKLYSEDRYFALALATLKLGAENAQNSVAIYSAIAGTYETRSELNNCNYEHPSDIANAAKYYQLAIPLNPDNADLHYNLSRTLIDRNLTQLALNEINIGLELSSTPESLANSAQSFSMLGHQARADELLQQALTKGYSPKDTGYHEIYMNQGNWKSAAEGFNAYIKSRDKFTVYDLIKSDLIAQQAQVQPWTFSTKIAFSNKWEESLYHYWTKKISDDDLKKIAINTCEKTEYYFYTGYRDLQTGNKTEAKAKFANALKENTFRFIERPLARYFLQQN